MQFYEFENKIENLITELEKRFRQFKKIDIFKAVSNAYKIVKPIRHLLTSRELEEIRFIAVRDLSIS